MAVNRIQKDGWRVTVPATAANLGCAFDCGGIALSLYMRASFHPSAAPGLTLEYHGQNPERVPRDSSNLLVRALQFAARQLGEPSPSGHIVVRNEIPVCVGLGSSAAAVLAGLLLGAGCSGREAPEEQILSWAGDFEGHIDNAAAAYEGGLVFGLMHGPGHVTTIKTEFPAHLRLVLVTPDTTVSTREARRALPSYYDRTAVMHTLHRATLLAATCASGKFDLFPELFDDRLHQPYRQQLAPGISRCLHYRRAGMLGISISGSGPTVMAIAEDNAEKIAQDLQWIFREEGIAAESIVTSADNQGALAMEFMAGATREVLQ